MNNCHSTLNRLCLFMEILLVASLLVVFITCSYFLYYMHADEVESISAVDGESGWFIKESIVFIFDNFIVSLILIQLKFFFKGVRMGELFSKRRIYETRTIGITLVASYFLSLLIRYATGVLHSDNSSMDYIFIISSELYGLLQVLFGVGLITLSSILKRAKELKDEQDLVI